MPPLPRLKNPALNDLAQQLRFVPHEAALRQIERAERLCETIDAGVTYPQDWLVYAITGYRPEIKSPALLRGDELLADICVLIERLCDAAAMTEVELRALPGSGPARRARPVVWLEVADVCARWGISRKTLDRYRKRGLPARRVADASGRHKLLFDAASVERFGVRHAPMIDKAAAFSRIPAEMEARMLRRAKVYSQKCGLSLNQAASRLSARFGRGHETVRQLLRRHVGAGAPASERVFDAPGPITRKQTQFAERAFARGIPASQIAERIGHGRASVTRALAQRRAERLRSILDEPWAGRFQEIGPGDQKASHILNAPVARSGLAGPGTITLATMMEDASRPGGPDPSVERARARAHAVLLARSIAAIRPLTRDRCPAPVLDAIETDLRWASRLQAELVRSQQALMYKTIQGHLGSQVTSLTRSRALSVLQASITAVSAAVDHFDPEKGGRLAAPAGLALNRVVSQWARADGHTGRGPDAQTAGPRAVRSLKPTDVALHDWALNLNSWQAWLEPDPRVRPALPSLDESARNLLERRYGWAGGPPESVQQIAASMHTSPARASRLLHEALRSALVAARRGPHAAQAPERGSG